MWYDYVTSCCNKMFWINIFSNVMKLCNIWNVIALCNITDWVCRLNMCAGCSNSNMLLLTIENPYMRRWKSPCEGMVVSLWGDGRVLVRGWEHPCWCCEYKATMYNMQVASSSWGHIQYCKQCPLSYQPQHNTRQVRLDTIYVCP